MKKKHIAYIVLALVYFFPFRWAFLQYPEPVKVNDNYVDAGRVEYIIYFLLTVIGTLLFMALTFKNPETEETKINFNKAGAEQIKTAA